jgi:hypothetical protein
MLSPCLLDIVADIVFIAWGASKTGQDLRALLINQYQPIYITRTQLRAGFAARPSL